MNLLDILTPLYLLIALGYTLKKFQFPNEDFWPGIERMSYYILFPTLIFVALIKANIDLSLIGTLIVITLIPTIISGMIQWFGFISPSLTGPSFSSMFQGSLRSNTIIALVIVAWIVPDKGLAIMAVILLIMVPMNNLLSILVLLRYGKKDNLAPSNWWRGILRNPLILACASGLIFNILGISLPSSLVETAEFLGRSALPFALLAVGAGLKLDSLFSNKLIISFSSFSKLILAPFLSVGLCLLLEVDSDIAKSAIIFSAMPTAVSCYILAKQMGGDAQGMAQIITFQTLMAAFTLPLFLLIAQRF